MGLLFVSKELMLEKKKKSTTKNYEKMTKNIKERKKKE